MESDYGTDDIFANSSTDTVKEICAHDISIAVKSEKYPNDMASGSKQEEDNKKSGSWKMDDDCLIAYQVIEGYCKPLQKVYCPFCPMLYASDHLLKVHLKDQHGPHLNLILNDESCSLMFQSCTLCHATFYIKGLLPLHLLRAHENALVGLINCRNAKYDQYLYCMYCRFAVVKNNSKSLMLHLEKMHFQEFECFILANYSKRVSAQEVMSSYQDQPKFIHYSSSLNRPRIRASLSTRGLHSSVRRKLDFNMMDDNHVRKFDFQIPVRETACQEVSVNKIGKKKKKTILKHLFSKKAKKSHSKSIITSTPVNLNADPVYNNKSDISFRQFRCASCHQTFRSNPELLSHVSHCHKWPWDRLHPCYSCGFCEATFYRNSFLLRHTVSHHTPKCLRSAMKD